MNLDLAAWATSTNSERLVYGIIEFKQPAARTRRQSNPLTVVSFSRQPTDQNKCPRAHPLAAFFTLPFVFLYLHFFPCGGKRVAASPFNFTNISQIISSDARMLF